MDLVRHAVFVHGAGGGGWEWDIWRRVFVASGWHTTTPDLQPVAAGLAATRLDDYAAQVVSWLHGVDAPVLIGASLGGLLALMAAARVAPAALVLINPLPPVGIEPRPARADYPKIVPWGSRRSLASTLRALPDVDAAACLFAFRHWRDESGAVIRDACAGVVVDMPRCPLLILASELDEDVPAQASRALADSCAAEFRLLKGASHVGPLLGRDASRVAGAVVVWLEFFREELHSSGARVLHRSSSPRSPRLPSARHSREGGNPF